MTTSAYEERDGKLYVACYRCGNLIPSNKLGGHLRGGCSPGSKPTGGTERGTDSARGRDHRREKTIREICQNRGIERLVHFTRIESLRTIIQQGLLTRATLERRKRVFLPVDADRFDRRTDTISLSISFPNYQMFYKCRLDTDDESWVVLSLKPAVLWELSCSFFPENAASKQMRDKPLTLLQKPTALQSMFSEQLDVNGIVLERNKLSIPTFYPTSAQAEVLVHGPIPRDHIFDVAFHSYRQREEWIGINGNDWAGISFSVQPGFFRRRPGAWPPAGDDEGEYP